MGINININVNTASAQQNAQGVAQALNQVASAGANAAKAAGGAQRQFAQLAGAFVQMTVGKQLLGVFGAVATRADAITMGMQNIKTVMEESFGAGEEEKLKSRIMEVAETTGKSFGDVADATKNLIAQGLSPDQANTLLMPLMKFATVGDLSIQKATDLTVALTNMGIGAKSAGAAFDVMFNLSRKTSLETKDFADIMTRTAPVAATVGMSFNELAVTAAFMRKSFGAAKLESTALANTLLFLEKTKPEAKIKAAFGVDVIEKTTGRLKPLLTLIQEVGTAMSKGKGNEHDIADIFGGKTGAQVFAGGLATLRQGMNFGGKQLFGQELIDAMRATPGQSGGAVGEAFTEKMQALTPQVERLKAAFDDLMGTVGSGFADSLTKAATGMADMLGSMRSFLNDNPAFKSAIGFLVDQFAKLGGIVGVFAIIGGGFSILRTALAPVLATMISLTGAIRGAGVAASVAGLGFKGMFRALAGPLGLVLLLVDLIPSIFGFLKGLGQNVSDNNAETGKSLQDAALSNQGAAEAMNKSAEALAEVTKEFNSIVAMYTGAAVKKFPVLDPRSEGVLNAILNTVGTTAKVPEAGLAPMRNAFHDAFLEARTKGNISNDTMNAATVAAQQAIFYARRSEALGVPGAGKQAQQIDDFLKQLEIMASPQMVLGTKRDRMIQGGINITRPNGGSVEDVFGPEASAVQNFLNGTPGSPRRFGPGEPTMEQRQTQFQKTIDFSILEAMKKSPATFTINSPVILQVGGESLMGTLRSLQQHEANTGLGSH